MIEIIKEKMLKDGYAFIQNFNTKNEAETIFESIGKIDTLEGFDNIQSLTPQSEDNSTANTYSGNYGLGEFPLHTDLAHWASPPRYVALRCEIGTTAVATRVLDSIKIINFLGEDLLFHSLVTPRRPLRYGHQLMRILDTPNIHSATRVFRWDALYLRAANKTAIEALEKIRSLLKDIPPLEFSLTNRGDLLIMDNWRILHGRSSVDASSAVRNIKRAYLSKLI